MTQDARIMQRVIGSFKFLIDVSAKVVEENVDITALALWQLIQVLASRQ